MEPLLFKEAGGEARHWSVTFPQTPSRVPPDLGVVRGWAVWGRGRSRSGQSLAGSVPGPTLQAPWDWLEEQRHLLRGEGAGRAWGSRRPNKLPAHPRPAASRLPGLTVLEPACAGDPGVAWLGLASYSAPS